MILCIMISDLIEKNIALLNEAIGYAEEARDAIECKNVTTYNEDIRLELAKQFITKCEQQIQELKEL